MSPLLYYTVSKKELCADLPAEAVLLSAASFYRPCKTLAQPLRMPRIMPAVRHAARWRGADCGAFTATMRWGGSYRFTPLDYIAWLYQWLPHWAACMDLCCLSPTGGDPGRKVVLARQRYTTSMVERFWFCYRNVPWAWCPTITGYSMADFEHHARTLAPLIRPMCAYYSDPGRWDEGEEDIVCHAFRVGIGSLCGRAPAFIAEVVARVQAIIGQDVPLHLWGVKLKVLQSGIELPGVVSCDTGAWNNLFGHEHERRRTSGLTEVQYSWQISYPAYAQKIRRTQQRPQQRSFYDALVASTCGFPLIAPDVFMDDAPEAKEHLVVGGGCSCCG